MEHDGLEPKNWIGWGALVVAGAAALYALKPVWDRLTADEGWKFVGGAVVAIGLIIFALWRQSQRRRRAESAHAL
jgi:hypothetical protein